MKIFVSILSLLLYCGIASASPITFVFEGVFNNGSYDGLPFTNESFTLTVTADTDNISSFSNGLSVDSDSAALELQGISHNVLTATSVYVNHEFGLVGFSNAALGNDLLIGPFDNIFETWDLASSIGPVTAAGFVSEFGSPLSIQGGTLRVEDDFDGTLTFAAFAEDTSAVPEPSTVAMVGLGLVVAGVFRRRFGEKERDRPGSTIHCK